MHTVWNRHLQPTDSSGWLSLGTYRPAPGLEGRSKGHRACASIRAAGSRRKGQCRASPACGGELSRSQPGSRSPAPCAKHTSWSLGACESSQGDQPPLRGPAHEHMGRTESEPVASVQQMHGPSLSEREPRGREGAALWLRFPNITALRQVALSPGEERGPQGWERQARETADTMVPSSHVPLCGDPTVETRVHQRELGTAGGRDGGCVWRALWAQSELRAPGDPHPGTLTQRLRRVTQPRASRNVAASRVPVGRADSRPPERVWE